MKDITKVLFIGLFLFQAALYAQSTGSIAGTVSDPNGAVVPGASIKVKGTGGQEFTTVSNDSGGYRIPSVQNGIYVVTVTATGFKTSTFTNVKVDVGTRSPLTPGLRSAALARS